MILFTGKGGPRGSYEIRARQLAVACHGIELPNASSKDMDDAENIVVVKRVSPDLLRRLKGRPWIFDCVDFYPQPNRWERDGAIDWVKHEIARLNPAAMIWPNQRMKNDCSDGRPSLVLYHHGRPSSRKNVIRETLTTVGYEGRECYLADWVRVLVRECGRRGWNFEINPPSISALDIVVAFRGGEWDSYTTRHWKSNVKLANAHISMTPFIGQPDDAYVETASGFEYWATDSSSLIASFNWLESFETRNRIAESFAKAAYHVDRAAKDLKDFLATL